jgi:hypothetical protein
MQFLLATLMVDKYDFLGQVDQKHLQPIATYQHGVRVGSLQLKVNRY